MNTIDKMSLSLKEIEDAIKHELYKFNEDKYIDNMALAIIASLINLLKYEDRSYRDISDAIWHFYHDNYDSMENKK